jgi:hypothetical protein
MIPPIAIANQKSIRRPKLESQARHSDECF